jgi:hypothetical protein
MAFDQLQSSMIERAAGSAEFLRQDILRRSKYCLGLLLLCLLFVGCRKYGSDKLQQEDLNLTQRTEKGLGEYYEMIELNLRKDYGITVVQKINTMMQIFIDEGDIYEPFIVDKSNGEARMKFVSYVAYKQFYQEHERDTTGVFSIEFDSLGLIN